jgi:hypothetical protein
MRSVARSTYDPRPPDRRRSGFLFLPMTLLVAESYGTQRQTRWWERAAWWERYDTVSKRWVAVEWAFDEIRR